MRRRLSLGVMAIQMLRYATFFLLLVVTGCFSVPISSISPDHFVGCWTGEAFQPASGDNQRWKLNRRPEGTFTIFFTALAPNATAWPQMESGTWSYKNGRYITITTEIDFEPTDLSDPSFTDTYEIVSLQKDKMVYHHPGAGITFTSHRISCE